jgi:hypothetical protein
VAESAAFTEVAAAKGPCAAAFSDELRTSSGKIQAGLKQGRDLDTLYLRVNSLFLEINSLFPRNKFPVLLRREFCCKSTEFAR